MKIKFIKPKGMVSDKSRAICTKIKDTKGQPKVMRYNQEYEVKLEEYNSLVECFGRDNIVLADEVKSKGK